MTSECHILEVENTNCRVMFSVRRWFWSKSGISGPEKRAQMKMKIKSNQMFGHISDLQNNFFNFDGDETRTGHVGQTSLRSITRLLRANLSNIFRLKLLLYSNINQLKA